MLVFIKKICWYLVLLLLASYVTVLATGMLGYTSLIKRGRGSVIDKNNRLDSIRGRKMILVGGSNVCYGINSKLIEDSLELQVVDMAINLRMGMSFYYNQVKHAVKPGDIVVGIPEYDAYSGEYLLGDAGTYNLALIDKRNLKYLTTEQWLRSPFFLGDIIADNLAAFISTDKNKITEGRYRYNVHGDYGGHKFDSSQSYLFKEEPSFHLKTFSRKKAVDGRFRKILYSFSKYCDKQGAIYLHSFPVYPKDMHDPMYSKIIQDNLNELQWIGNAENYLYSFEELYNTPNHLVYSMRDDRTIKLIRDIRLALAKPK